MFFTDGWIDSDFEPGDEFYQIDCYSQDAGVLYIFTVDLEDGYIIGMVY